MKKQKQVIKVLEECISLESKAIPLYTRHLNDPDFFKDINPEDAGRMKKALKALASDAKNHLGIFESLMVRLKETEKK